MKKIALLGLLFAISFSLAFTSLPASIDQLDTSNIITAAQTQLSILEDKVIEDLIYMREEEKLAHDVYQFLHDQWGLPIFSNIAGSELTHTSVILTLLNRYSIPDPAQDLAAGEFNNADLQALYNQLIEQGSLSLADALKVGLAIEEIDILDLQERIEGTQQADIQLVYKSLLQGSYNHLRAFAGTLMQQTGETYQPQYLSVEEYQEILQASGANGFGNGQRGNPNGYGWGR